MKATEILENVKSLLGVELSEDKKIVLASEKLANGTEIEADSFETGSAVFIQTEDESVPLPAGDYELESGKILVVIEEGVIAEIKDASEPEAEAKEEVEAAEEEEAPKETEMEYVSKEEFSSAIDEIKAMIDELAPKKEEAKEEVEASEVVETEMAAQPIVANPEKEVEAFQFNYQQNVRLDRQQRIKNILNNLK
jgi:6-phosphofructokinase